jgi:acyl dehydratase
MSERTRSFTITEARIRAYSRRGNYHSDAETASALGLPGLVAQGTQAFGPAYALALEQFGDDLLERGEIDVKFVGLVMAGDAVEAHVADTAAGVCTVEVHNTSSDRTAVIGTITCTEAP